MFPMGISLWVALSLFALMLSWPFKALGSKLKQPGGKAEVSGTIDAVLAANTLGVKESISLRSRSDCAASYKRNHFLPQMDETAGARSASSAHLLVEF